MDVAGVVIMGGTMEWLLIIILPGAVTITVTAILDRAVGRHPHHHHRRGRGRHPGRDHGVDPRSSSWPGP